MTNDELERIMNFMIERQEVFDARQERMAAQAEQQQLIVNALLDSQNTLTATVLRIAETHSAQIAEHGRQIAATNETVNRLSATVDRYISARGNGSNGH